jgi:hypothetical protein
MRRSLSPRNRIAHVQVCLGGVGQKLLPHYVVHPNARDTVVVTDVESENAVSQDFRCRLEHSLAITLGEAETSRTLLVVDYPIGHPIHAAIGVSSGRQGMGQARRLGQIAAELALKSTQCRDALDAIRDRLIICCGGVPNVVDVELVGSIAGGTSSGAVVPIGGALARELASFGAVVHLRFQLVDSITFAGLGRHVDCNAAAFIHEALLVIEQLRTEIPPDRLVCDLNVSSLPPSGHDDHIRTRRIRTTYEARQCPSFQKDEQRSNPNHVMAGSVGNVTFSTYDQFESIPSVEMAGVVAQEYYPDIRSVLDAHGTSNCQVRHFDPDHRSTPVFRPDLDEVFANLSSQSNEQFLSATMAVGEVHRFRVSAVTLDDIEFELDIIPSYFAAQPRTLSAAVSNLNQLCGIRNAIEQEIEATDNQIQELRETKNRAEKELVAILERVRKPSWFGSSEKMLGKARLLAEKIRLTNDDLLWNIGFRDRLLSHLEQVRDEEQSQLRRLESIRDILNDHRPKATPAVLHPLFLCKRIEDAFCILVDLPSHSREMQEILLGSTFTELTLHGLQRLSGAPNSAIETIVDTLAGDAPVPGPGVGGVVPAVTSPVYVLPTMSPLLEEAVTQAFKTRMPQARVYFHLATMGLEVTRILDYRPLHRDNCFPGLLRGALKKSMEKPNLWLFHNPAWVEGDAPDTDDNELK